ncbi:MAG: DUF3795 domain-containing protein [Euryarchaeota archaeon]|nr:DUF3795 domain-containing protein [Euryarchaeota archaeon]
MSYCSIEYRKKVGKEIESGVSTPALGKCGILCEICNLKEMGECQGCSIEVPKVDPSKQCRVYRCVQASQFEFCFQCGNFPCDIYKETIMDCPLRWMVLRKFAENSKNQT